MYKVIYRTEGQTSGYVILRNDGRTKVNDTWFPSRKKAEDHLHMLRTMGFTNEDKNETKEV